MAIDGGLTGVLSTEENLRGRVNLANFVSEEELQTILRGYITDGELANELLNYATRSMLSDYVTNVGLSGILDDYIDKVSILDYNFVTETRLAETLAAYTPKSDFNALGLSVMNGALNITYTPEQE